MALTISTGFVVDDAIVMIENMFRYLEKGASPLRATLKGAKQILSLIHIFEAYHRSLIWVLRHQRETLLVTLATLAATIFLYICLLYTSIANIA